MDYFKVDRKTFEMTMMSFFEAVDFTFDYIMRRIQVLEISLQMLIGQVETKMNNAKVIATRAEKLAKRNRKQ